MTLKIADIRREYILAGLNESEADADPVRQFAIWFQQALDAELPDANAMTLATADSEGHPSARIVLLKSFDEGGFVFFTNYESHKGRELAENPHAALVFYWGPLDRQVRIEGTAEQVSREESQAYFTSRPEASQLGAWASRQSEVIASREQLERQMEELAARYGDGMIPLPPYWGGYRVRPERIEFWQGRPSRLHDRLRYERNADGTWRISRLSP
jgi:pyridoxamine 5'-phosphate oxidase